LLLVVSFFFLLLSGDEWNLMGCLCQVFEDLGFWWVVDQFWLPIMSPYIMDVEN
jgi:hypothetical protein